MSRQRNTSPFPSAYRVITDYETDRTPTIPCPPLPELLDACRHRDVTCSGCGTVDDLGFDWHHAIIVDDSGNSRNEWYCKLCFKRETTPLPYRYKTQRLDNAVDEPFRKKKTP